MAPDIGTGLEALAASQGAKTFLGPIAERVLGPTADYLGGGLAEWSKKQRENIDRIFKRADERLTDDQRQHGSVPPKVLKAVISDGAFTDDNLTASYFGGVLASSKSEVGRDDRGASLAALVGRLSTYQIRTHYLIYAHARTRLVGTPLNFLQQSERAAHARVFIPTRTWFMGMDFSDAEVGLANDILSDAIQGMLREDLIDDNFGFGSPQHVASMGFGAVTEPGIAVQLAPLGVQLFVWAHGQSVSPHISFLDPSVELSMPDAPTIGTEALVSADQPELNRRKREQAPSTDSDEL